MFSELIASSEMCGLMSTYILIVNRKKIVDNLSKRAVKEKMYKRFQIPNHAKQGCAKLTIKLHGMQQKHRIKRQHDWSVRPKIILKATVQQCSCLQTRYP